MRSVLALLGCLAIATIYGTELGVYAKTGTHEAGHCFVSQVIDRDPSDCRIDFTGPRNAWREDDGLKLGHARMASGVNVPHAWEHPAIYALEVLVLTGITLPFALLTTPALASLGRGGHA